MYINPESIQLDSIQDLLTLTLYKPKTKALPGDGYVLAEDLVSKDKGGILYAKGMELDYDKIERLLRLRENNPDWDLSFVIQKNEKLTETLNKRVKADFIKLLESRKSRNEYRRLMEKVGNTLDTYYTDIVNSDEMVYLLTQAKFTDLNASEDGLTPYYNLSIQCALLTVGIFQQTFEVTNKKFSKENIITGARAALLHAIGGIETAPLYKGRAIEEKEVRFYEGNRNSWAVANRLGLPTEVSDTIKLIAGYQEGKRDFVEQDTLEADIANIVNTAIVFNMKVANPFGKPGAAKDAVDKMYVMATDGALLKLYVDALAKGLRFEALFDFYYEIEKLNRSCPYGHGQAYPLTGFKSPVIYLCRANLNNCPHFQTSAKAVTIFRKTGGLEEGSYGRCKWLSSSLIKFYEGFYSDIKEETLSKED